MAFSDDVRLTLARILSSEGDVITREPQRLYGLLLDKVAGRRGEIILVMAAREEGVVEALSGVKDERSAALLIPAWVRRCQDDLRLTREGACWVVGTWAAALQVPGAEEAISRTVKPAVKPPIQPGPPPRRRPRRARRVVKRLSSVLVFTLVTFSLLGEVDRVQDELANRRRFASISAEELRGADPSGTYVLAGSVGFCQRVNDCTLGEQLDPLTIVVEPCGSRVCVARSARWETPVQLSFDGQAWTASGDVGDSYRWRCDETLVPTYFEIDLHVDRADSSSGGWEAELVRGSYLQRSSDFGFCESASMHWDVEGEKQRLRPSR